MTASVVASFTGAILNLIGILILNQIYGRIAIKLNNWVWCMPMTSGSINYHVCFRKIIKRRLTTRMR